MRLEVIRNDKSEKQILGDMFVIDEKDAIHFKCDTLELPDLNNDGIDGNEKGKSCIPEGTYICTKRAATVAIPYEHILINNVQGRDGVCIHKANYVHQIKGCIAVGEKEIDINGDGLKDVTNSGKTFMTLMALLPNEFKLIIK